MMAMEVTFDGDTKIIEIVKPSPKENEILVKVISSAIDTAFDAVITKKFYASFVHSMKAPLILGWHYSGTVEALGVNVTDLKIGDAVWGHLQYEPKQKQGAFAEYITVAAGDCAIKPDGIGFDVAAAAATEACTALQALRDCGGLGQGKSVLIVGAGGGVGTVAVGIAKRIGSHVTAVCSTKDVERVHTLGADVVLNRSEGDPLTKNKAQFDVIFDTPTSLSSLKCLKFLKPGGTYVATLPSWGMLISKPLTVFSTKKVTMVETVSKRQDLELIGQWLEGGLQIPVDSQYKICDLKTARERQNMQSRIGRVVINVAGGWS